MKREALPAVSAPGEVAFDHYEQVLRSEEDLSAVTIRNYLSDIGQFAIWCEGRSWERQEEASPFAPSTVVTPRLTAYQAYLQHTFHLKPASVSRSLVSLKGISIHDDTIQCVSSLPHLDRAYSRSRSFPPAY